MLISSYWALVHNDGLHLVKIKHAIAQLMCTLSYGWQLQWNPVYPHDFFIWLPVTKKIHSYVRKLKIYIIVLWFSAVSKAKSNLSCYIDDVELIRTNWCSNQKKKICSLTCLQPFPSDLHGSNMQPLKLLSSSITGKKEYQKHLSKHEQSQTNQQVASLSNKKKYFLSSHLQASSSSSRARISAVATHQPIVSHRFRPCLGPSPQNARRV